MSLYMGGNRIGAVGVVFNGGLDKDVRSGNIRTGIRILDTVGSFTDPSTLTGSGRAAAAGDIVSGAGAWVNGAEVDGTLVVNRYYTGSSEPATSFGNDGDIYLVIRQ